MNSDSSGVKIEAARFTDLEISAVEEVSKNALLGNMDFPGAVYQSVGCPQHQLSAAQLSAVVLQDDMCQVGVSFTENRYAVVSGVVKVPWGLLKRRQPSDGSQSVLAPTTGTLGVVPVPWARLHGLRPKLKAHPELVYSA